MEIKDLISRAVEVREKYAELEKKKYGKEWTEAQIMEGFVGDVGDLMKLVMAREGVRTAEALNEKLEHELMDCLWSILVLSKKFDVNMETSFPKAMDRLEKRIARELLDEG
ncbi:nucleotide pyrophosphohydrolase [Patescibacteria group bacterium]|nr:nucleotide pyrophosphohydrolase [Patescibacteria group bacterium]MCL5114413.1 nucleotide pyrophosphohydrolase [Patescibacteria group bacterium]